MNILTSESRSPSDQHQEQGTSRTRRRASNSSGKGEAPRDLGAGGECAGRPHFCRSCEQEVRAGVFTFRKVAPSQKNGADGVETLPAVCPVVVSCTGDMPLHS